MATDQLVNLLAGITLIETMVTLGLCVKVSDVLAVGKQRDLLVRALWAQTQKRGYTEMLCLAISMVLVGRLVTRNQHEKLANGMILTTSVRNAGVSLVIATGSFPESTAITSATTCALFKASRSLLIARARRQRRPGIPLVQPKAA